MFTRKRSIPTVRIISLIAFVSLAILQPPALFAQRGVGTGFTYQGQLKDGGVPADGSYDLRFSMFDALRGGNQWRAQVCVDNVNVVDGLFTVEIDFGDGIFDDGQAWWLEVEVRADLARDNCSVDGRYETLSPRQPLTATPYALYALNSPGDGLWTTSGDSITNTNPGTVAISSPGESVKLRITGPSRSGLDGHVVIRELPGDARQWRMVLDGNDINTWDTNYPDPISLSLNSQSAGDVLLANGGGNVGIGTTTPAARLEVVSLGRAILGSSENSVGVRGNHTGTGAAAGVYGETESASSNAAGVVGVVNRNPAGEFSAGVRGVNAGQSGNGIGVYGSQSGSGWGVYGHTPSGRGVFGSSPDGVGVYGLSDNAIAGWFRGAENNGTTAALGVKSGSQVMLLDGNEIDATGGPLYLNNNSRFAVVVPVIEITGADLAEKFPTSEKPGAIEPGTVMEIDPDNPGKLRIARGAYNRRVAGVVSGANGLPTGAILGHLPGNEDAPAIALSGRVWVKCDATQHEINVGDLITTADRLGYGMAVTAHSRALGAVLGKAMTGLARGESGMVLVLVNLQ